MFYYLDGTIAMLEQSLAVVDCGGVGYACHTSQHTVGKLKIGQKARLYTYLHVREDIFDLFGFAEHEELRFFQMLISVTGVGPKAALAILSIAPPSELALSIITEDEKLLTQAPGIGKKTAQRIVLELRDKMSQNQLEISAQPAVAAMQSSVAGSVNHTQEAVAAMMVLGYTQAEAIHAMNGVDTASLEADEIIRICLKKLAAQ